MDAVLRHVLKPASVFNAMRHFVACQKDTGTRPDGGAGSKPGAGKKRGASSSASACAGAWSYDRDRSDMLSAGSGGDSISTTNSTFSQSFGTGFTNSNLHG